MGNQLVGFAPSQILPTEEYLRAVQFEPELCFDTNMGSTRFFKVARARTDEGNVVVKVFLKHDPTLNVADHASRLEHLKKYLTNAVNCLPYQRSVVTEKAVFILREYVRHSLYDKVSTRPFMTTLEKRWITFQILCALHQCHKHRICHGDIKLENILITSWNWVLLSDFASFKPTYLPVNNPADFTYFFDTSRRRACYIAPERFLEPPVSNEPSTEESPPDPVPTADSDATVTEKPAHTFPKSVLTKSIIGSTIRPAGDNVSEELLPEMDIFAAGCALLELWSEGKAPFDLAQLLAYRKRNVEQVDKVLRSVRNVYLRDLIASMISLEPADRLAADVYLDRERGRLFPDYFYTFLQSYMQMFSSIPIMSPDDKIMRLYSDMDHIVSMLCRRPADWVLEPDENDDDVGATVKTTTTTVVELEKRPTVADGVVENAGDGDAKTNDAMTTNEGLIIMTTLVTSCTRGLQHCTTKIRCLEILQQLAEHSDSETILDRILPYILYFTADPMARVRVCAIDTLTDCLHLITEITRRDADVFPEYVLPSIAMLATDCAVVVRVAYARNIARLAETAVRFLEQTTQAFRDEDTPPLRFETELGALQEMVQQTVSCLLTDSAAIVKQTLIETNVDQLCRFFGPQKANDLILSHMITFLNDKDDTNLRGSFFDSIVQVAAFVGWECSGILVPLLLQGLTDPDEYLVAKSIRATSTLCDLGLIQKSGLSEFIGECAAYLNHPNLWIRHETCGLLAASTRMFSAIDVQCKVMPQIVQHMRGTVLQLERADIVMNNLHAPISRHIFDSVTRFADIQMLMQTLEDRVARRKQEAHGDMAPQPETMSQSLRNFFRRLTSEALTELEEMQLLSMKTYLIKLNKHRAHEHRVSCEGKIVLQKVVDVCHEFALADRPLDGYNGRNHPAATTLGDWQQMFIGGGGGVGGGVAGATKAQQPQSGHDSTVAGFAAGLFSVGTSAGLASVSGNGQTATTGQNAQLSSLIEYSMAERSFMQERHSECRTELDAMRGKIKQHYNILAGTRNFDTVIEQRDLPHGWRLKGNLVTHLHEHRAAVTKLTSLHTDTSHGYGGGGGLFASCSLDGTVRVWDINKLDGQQSINRSTQVYSANVPLQTMAATGGDSLAVAGRDGSLMLLRLDSNTAKMALQGAKNLAQASAADGGGELPVGPVVDMQPLLHGSQNLIVYATLYGTIVCWDLRMQEEAWRVKTALRNGVVTTICADSTSSWMATGTSGGKHVCWDLRFRLPIAEIRHPFDYRIRKIVAHPTEHSKLISTTAGNNEVSIWDIETQHRQGALWASNAPPLTNQGNQNATSSTVCGLVTGTIDGSPFVLTAGSDQRIRYWDLAAIERPGAGTAMQGDARVRYMTAPSNCAVVVPAARESPPESQYNSRLIDGTTVIYEINASGSSLAAGSAQMGAQAGSSPATTITQNAAHGAGRTQSSATGGSGNSSTNTVGGGGGGPAEEQQPRSGPDQPPAGHNDVITDLLLCRSHKQQFFVASASRDGVIKLWK